MAVEALPNKNQDQEDTKKRRSAYVGPTRARDELFITYTKRNDIIDKLHDAPTSLISPWTWPDDFKKD
jgi:superfamily I DNA/RNA helicase